MGSGAVTRAAGETTEPPRTIFRNPDFLVPYVAETQSIGGDQIGRVALSILVFDRTGSVAWTAFTYALTYVPAILGGFLLGGMGDRFPRVWVMVGADVARAVLFVAVAVPGTPLAVVVALIAVAFFLGPAFTAAMVSRLAAVLVPDQFRAASGIRMISSQTVQVAGFALGGVIVAALDPRTALLVNAGTFAVSALVIGLALRPGSAATGSPPGEDGAHAAAPASTAGPRHAAPEPASSQPPRLWGDPWLRHLLLMTMLAAFFVVPEGLAVPLADRLHASDAVAGLLLAAGPLGSAVGAAVLVRFVSFRRGMGVARLMSLACGAPLLITAVSPPWPVVAACWALSGGLWAYQIDVATAVVHSVPDRWRARIVSRASAALLGAQGLGLILFGAIGGAVGPAVGVALAGLCGCLAAAATAATGRQSEMSRPDTKSRRPRPTAA